MGGFFAGGTFKLQIPNGTILAPGFPYASDLTTGFYYEPTAPGHIVAGCIGLPALNIGDTIVSVGLRTPNASVIAGLFTTAVGNAALSALTTGQSNTAVGHNALTAMSAGSGNVAIGESAGAQELGSNTLYISNTNTTTPLIKGVFDPLGGFVGSLTFNVASLTVTNGGSSTVITPGAPISGFVPRNYLSSCVMSTAGASTTMSVAEGQAADSTNVVMMNLSAIAKTTAAWVVGTAQGGLDTGAIANSTWYYFYVIRRPDTGVVDVVFSLSSAAPTLPANYTQYRYIGAGLTNGSGQWTKFTQIGREFWLDTPVLDFNAAGSAARVSLTCSVPRGRKMKGIFVAQADGGAGGSQLTYLSDLSNADLAPSLSVAPLSSVAVNSSAGTQEAGLVMVWTNTSAQIGHREVNTNTVKIVTLGWMDLADTQ